MKLPILASLSIAVPTLCRPDGVSHGEACASGSSCDAAKGDAMLQVHLHNSKIGNPQAYVNTGNGACRINGDNDQGYGCWGKMIGYTDEEIADKCASDAACMAWWKHDHSDGHQTFCLAASDGTPAGGYDGACRDTYNGYSSTRRRVSRRRRTYTRRRICSGSLTKASDLRGRPLDPAGIAETTPCMVKTNCTCSDGSPGLDCEAGQEKCTSCNEGFVLQDDVCEPPFSELGSGECIDSSGSNSWTQRLNAYYSVSVTETDETCAEKCEAAAECQGWARASPTACILYVNPGSSSPPSGYAGTEGGGSTLSGANTAAMHTGCHKKN